MQHAARSGRDCHRISALRIPRRHSSRGSQTLRAAAGVAPLTQAASEWLRENSIRRSDFAKCPESCEKYRLRDLAATRCGCSDVATARRSNRSHPPSATTQRPSPFDSGHRKRLKSKPVHRAEARENDLNLRGLEIFEEASDVAFSEIHTHPRQCLIRAHKSVAQIAAARDQLD